MSTHQHEEWQMMESAKGGRYCGACGDHEPPAQVIPEAAVEAARVAIHRITLDDEFTHEEADALARAALEAAAPHMTNIHDDTQGEK